MRKAQHSGCWAFLAGVISPGFFCVQLSWGVPSTGLMLGCLRAVAAMAQTAPVSWIIRVEPHALKVTP
jgi:hypothetical protein